MLPHVIAASQVRSILRSDRLRWQLLAMVRDLHLPDSWIAAGFVRNAVWDHLHGRRSAPLNSDVDVIWFDESRNSPAEDRELEDALRAAAPSVRWSVKNQARMNIRNGDPPYASASDAMRYWPETATATAIRRHGPEGCEVAAPYGLDDLLNVIRRPTPYFAREKRGIYEERLKTKAWAAK